MELVRRIESREARIGVIGLGYVGLPLVIEFVKAGFPVTGFDVDEVKVRLLAEGTGYIRHIDVSPLAETGRDRFRATADFSLLEHMDCILICVPTPLTSNREPDMRFVESTARTMAKHLRSGQLVILESTTYPGTTDEDMRAILEDSGLKAGDDFYLAYSPEREDPNNSDFSLSRVPKVVGGFNPDSLRAAVALYNTVVGSTVSVSSTRIAEACKLLENIYRSVNIALVNELKMLFDRMDIDTWEVIEAAKTKPFGFQAFYPGPGLGGHCIPIDPFYLTWKAREYGMSTRFIELAGEINTSMPDYVVSRVITVLNERRKALRGANILLMGLAYKGNVDDDRESPSYHLMEKLENLGAVVCYHDPFIPEIRPSRRFSKFAGRQSVEPGPGYDLILVATPHDVFKTVDFASFGVPVVDTRNIVSGDGPWLYGA
ncbi:MAG: UDP-N-acetyl-D-glucosamine dehydrogenase [delta proteobacterium MLS_D]|jgi:UDP-N-acetyl-D-glucosamine dehydrogenase|nr:MAG: UDP-N-acetyl-D-glucosamine dehydrogenase [delta proteobacterium MLS_D]